MIRKYRKKPVVIEAEFITEGNMDRVAEWCRGSVRGIKLPPKDRVIQIQTLEGELEIGPGNWIIKGVEGEFYPCKASVFDATYEEDP